MLQGLQIARRLCVAIVAGLLVCGPASMAAAQTSIDPAWPEIPPAGPSAAKGVVVWSHGRSIDTEDKDSPTPPYLAVLRDAGWDVVRFNRMRVGDTLPASSQVLAKQAERFKAQGYKRVVLTGQSFGAFLSLMAAGRSDAVDAVVGTAPAAFGSFTDSYDTWQMNAQRLYEILGSVRRARTMLFFFHGDDFDPGGRGQRAREILAARGIDAHIVDKPADLVGHGAAASGLFVRRFGACIAGFIEGDGGDCDQSWGRRPSRQFVATTAATGSAVSMVSAMTPRRNFLGRWYGFYVNGREIMLSVDSVDGDRVRATYALGPGVTSDQQPEVVAREGRVVGNDLIFEEPNRNPLRFSVRPDGKLAGTWSSRDGAAQLRTVLHPLN